MYVCIYIYIYSNNYAYTIIHTYTHRMYIYIERVDMYMKCMYTIDCLLLDCSNRSLQIPWMLALLRSNIQQCPRQLPSKIPSGFQVVSLMLPVKKTYFQAAKWPLRYVGL